MAEVIHATIKKTSEKLRVYKLTQLGTDGECKYYDYDNMGADKKPSAPKADKKEFEKQELELGKTETI